MNTVPKYKQCESNSINSKPLHEHRILLIKSIKRKKNSINKMKIEQSVDIRRN